MVGSSSNPCRVSSFLSCFSWIQSVLLRAIMLDWAPALFSSVDSSSNYRHFFFFFSPFESCVWRLFKHMVVKSSYTLSNHLSYYLPDILLTVIYRLVSLSSISHRPLINLYSRWYLNLQCFCILVGCSSCLVLLVMMEWYFEKILHVVYILNEMDFLHRNAQVSHGMNITDSNFNLFLMKFNCSP